MDVKFDIHGIDDLMATLKTLGPAVTGSGTRFAMRKGANLVRDAAVANASSVDDSMTPEDIGRNIVVRFSNRTFKRTGDVMFRVGVLGGARAYANTKANARAGKAGQTYKTDGDKSNPGGDTWYWRFLEFGTEKHAARPFMRPALSENVNEVTATVATELDKWLTRFMKKAGK